MLTDLFTQQSGSGWTPKTEPGLSCYEFAPIQALATNLSITAALKGAIAMEDAAYGLRMPGSPLKTETPSPPISHQPSSSVLGRGLGGLPPSPNTKGKNLKLPLTERERKRRKAHHKKERAKEAARAKRREKRKESKRNTLPTEYTPHFPKGLGLPRPIASHIKPLSDFPVASTGYTGSPHTSSISEKHIWTLKELIEEGLDVFEWDGR
jgi:hypothetical protein